MNIINFLHHSKQKPTQPMVPTTRNRVFISYSHHDSEWLDRLRNILAPDIRNDRLDYWDDRELQSGDKWYDKILNSIDQARVAVLLVSPNFLDSHFIMEEELPRILAARENGLVILWVHLFGIFFGPNALVQSKAITNIQAAFNPSKPLAKYDNSSQTELLLDLCHQIQRLINPNRTPSNLPFNSLNNLFKGRDEDLAQCYAHFCECGALGTAKPKIITGMAGIGKTRLAIEYAWRHADKFSAYLFVSCTTPADLTTNFARLSSPDILDLPEYQSGKQEDQYAAVLRWFQRNKDWLIILDNLDLPETVAVVKKLVPRLSGGQVLITSRITGPKWGNAVKQMSLSSLPLNAAVTLLLEASSNQHPSIPNEVDQAQIIAKKVGCLPLALIHASAYISEQFITFAEYIKEFEENLGRILAYHDPMAIEYETIANEWEPESERQVNFKTITTTFFMSFDLLLPEAKAILRASSFLAPEPIPLAMFEENPDESTAIVKQWCDETGERPTGKPMSDAFGDLSRFSLITRSDHTFIVHQMERVVLRSQVASNQVSAWIEATRRLLIKYVPDDSAENPQTWQTWDMLRPHAEELHVLSIEDKQVKPHIALTEALGQLYFGKAMFEK